MKRFWRMLACLLLICGMMAGAAAEQTINVSIGDRIPEAERENEMATFVISTGLFMGKTTVCTFKGVVPEELAAVFAAEPNLDGWNCLCGTWMKAHETSYNGIDSMGMAAFEKEGRRILVLMARRDQQWSLWNLGTKALYQDPAMKLTISNDPIYGWIYIIRYDAEDSEQ